MASVKQRSLSLETPEGETETGDPTEPKSTFCSSLMVRVPDRNNLVHALNNPDRELEKRQRRFARYADDFQVYVKNERAGNRIMNSLQRLYKVI